MSDVNLMADGVAKCSPMKPRTLEALRGSIAKWQAIVDGSGADEGSFNCPLCRLFATGRSQPTQCRGCPVREVTGEKHCHGSPYHDFVHAEEDGDKDQMTAAARKELDFLISLLPHGETP